MLAVVKKPRIEIRAKRIPPSLLKFIRESYRPENVVIKDDDSEPVAVEDTEWYRKTSEETTPGFMIAASRGMFGWTQAVLAVKLNIAVQNISAMETGRRPVSKSMAVKLGRLFGCGPSPFFSFPENV